MQRRLIYLNLCDLFKWQLLYFKTQLICTMQLFDLPLELLREILGWAVAVRGTKRGLRLRLVNSKLTL